MAQTDSGDTVAVAGQTRLRGATRLRIRTLWRVQRVHGGRTVGWQAHDSGCDNLNTHGPGSLYETFAPEVAKALWDRFEFVYTPKHGSWLNMAEIELNVLIKQCLDRRIDNRIEMHAEVEAWQKRRDNMHSTIDWQFRSEDARIKLKRLYPTLDA